MILAEKIIDLRKKNGWSQEELAEKMEVSRQSISKWEGAQSVPDMNKIIKMNWKKKIRFLFRIRAHPFVRCPSKKHLPF